jgi:hypothetical protein
MMSWSRYQQAAHECDTARQRAVLAAGGFDVDVEGVWSVGTRALEMQGACRCGNPVRAQLECVGKSQPVLMMVHPRSRAPAACPPPSPLCMRPADRTCCRPRHRRRSDLCLVVAAVP